MKKHLRFVFSVALCMSALLGGSASAETYTINGSTCVGRSSTEQARLTSEYGALTITGATSATVECYVPIRRVNTAATYTEVNATVWVYDGTTASSVTCSLNSFGENSLSQTDIDTESTSSAGTGATAMTLFIEDIAVDDRLYITCTLPAIQTASQSYIYGMRVDLETRESYPATFCAPLAGYETDIQVGGNGQYIYNSDAANNSIVQCPIIHDFSGDDFAVRVSVYDGSTTDNIDCDLYEYTGSGSAGTLASQDSSGDDTGTNSFTGNDTLVLSFDDTLEGHSSLAFLRCDMTEDNGANAPKIFYYEVVQGTD